MINQLLRSVRILNTVSIQELSKSLNISELDLIKLEKGETKPSYDYLKDFSNYFNMSLSSLLYFHEVDKNSKKRSKKFKFFALTKLLSVLEYVANKKAKKFNLK